MLDSPMLSLAWKLRQIRSTEQDYLLGKVLTIIDSVVPNEKQNKAVKDVIKTAWYERSHPEDKLSEILRQFRDKFCPKIEEGYKDGYRLESPSINLDCQNYFPDN